MLSKTRWLIYSGFLILLITYLLLSSILNPYKAITTLGNNSQYGVYQNWLGQLILEKQQYTLCIYTGENKTFYPVEYLLINKTINNLEIQLICGPRPEDVLILKGEKAETYLKEKKIDLKNLDEAIQHFQ